MSDAYAEALGLVDQPARKANAPAGVASAADWKAASAAQKFGPDSVAIAKQELSDAKSPADRTAATKTLAYTQSKVGAQDAAPAANDPYAEALGFGAKASPAADAAPGASNPAIPPEAVQSMSDSINPMGGVVNMGRVLAHGVTAAGSSLYGLTRAAGALAGGANLNEAADEVRNAEEKYTYQPPAGSDAAKLLDLAGSKYSPLTLLNKGTANLGDRMLTATGSPFLATLADVGTNAAVQAGVGKVASKALTGGRPAAVQPAPRVEPQLDTPTAVPEQNLSLSPQETVPSKSPPFSGGAVTSPAPAPVITPTETIKSGMAIAQPEQAARAQVLRDVGFDQTRDAAIKGDNRARAVEYQMSKFDEPAGQAAAQQFAHEAQVMGDYTRGLIKDAGGTVGTDQGALYSRGQAIVRPIQALRDWFDDKASGLYKAADEKAQGQPVTLQGFGETLGDPSQLTNPDRVALQGAANAFAKKAGMTVGEDGTLSGTALQAETVRKWLNQERTNANGRFVDALKDSLDDDVGQSAGGPIYDQARALWRLRQQTLGDPKGISSLLDEEGTNRAVPFERVPDNVTKLPQDQFAHIVETLKNMPPELQGVANNALGEIKGQFYNKMLDGATGTRGGNGRPFWYGTSVKNVITDNSGKLQTLLSPDEVKSLDTLRKAGDVLSFDSSYPGAAAQAQNAVKRGLMSNVLGHATTAAGAGAGALIGMPTAGGVIGRIAGEKVAGAAGQKGALRKWESGSVNLRDIAGGKP